ncbi:hypothetical protein [Streptomyces cinereoruber]|uniref:hypothetical protein n=1 Tax=Streptomyces cinereoruber TaxID=67260 RepID=UPI003C2CEAF3
MAQQRTTLHQCLRYRFDNLVAGGTAVLIGWLAAACPAVVIPAGMVLVWADRKAPTTLSGRLRAVWAGVGQTLKIGGAVGSPVHVPASASLAPGAPAIREFPDDGPAPPPTPGRTPLAH